MGRQAWHPPVWRMSPYRWTMRRWACALDLSGRPFLVWDVEMPTAKIGTFDTELVREFFQALATHGGITLHGEQTGGLQHAPHRGGGVQIRGPARCVTRWRLIRARPMRSPRPRARSEGSVAAARPAKGVQMTTVLIDYDAGNLHSAEKAFQRMAREGDAGPLIVTADPDIVARAPTASSCPVTARFRPAGGGCRPSTGWKMRCWRRSNTALCRFWASASVCR